VQRPYTGTPPGAAQPLPLSSQELHIWLCPRDGVTDSDGFRRDILSRYAPLAPSEWRFTTGPRGKPSIANAPRPLAFNLSDSREWRACAVTAGGPVGVDIEYCDPGREVLRLARRYFHPREASSLEAVQEPERSGRFYDYWTLKEARVKSLGAALAPALATPGFDLLPPDGGEPGRIAELVTGPGTPPFYCLLDPLPDYRLAACWLCEAGIRPRLRLFHRQRAGTYATLRPGVRAASRSLTG